MSNDLDDRILDQASYAVREIIGQKPLGFPLGVLTLYGVTGAPSNSVGNNGDFLLRKDGGAGTRIYFKTGGAWTGIV